MNCMKKVLQQQNDSLSYNFLNQNFLYVNTFNFFKQSKCENYFLNNLQHDRITAVFGNSF